jgi:hypothetical protein
VAGGLKNAGAVFKLTPAGTETLLGSATNPSTATIYAGLIEDGAGKLYGTAFGGGSLDASVFEVSPKGGGAKYLLHLLSVLREHIP